MPPLPTNSTWDFRGSCQRLSSSLLSFHRIPQTMFHGLVSFFVFQLLLVAGASGLSLTIPDVVTFGQTFTAFWTRTETDPTGFDVSILVNGAPFVGPFRTGVAELSGNFTVPGLIPVGTYLVQATDSDDGHILATSNKFQIVLPGGSNPGTTASSPGATTTANPNQGNPASAAETTKKPTSSPRSQTQSTTFSSSPVSTPTTSLSSTDSHVISRSSQTSTTTTSSLAGPTLGSPSTHTSSPRVNRLPIIIGVCAAVLVLVICVLLALYLLRRRRRRQREEQFEPEPTPFILNPESYIQTRQRSSRVEKGLRKSRAPRNSTSNSPIESGAASTKFPDRRSRASRAVSSSDSSDQTLSSPSSGPRDLTDLDHFVAEGSSRSGSVMSSATLPVAFFAEYQRLRLENQILRRDMPGSESIYGDTLPPSYPGSGRASMHGMPMPLHTI
ncbi:hypothetical protein C8J56DRAFT_961193 [Mycena floridula]|nr:hypothetical protein C8J56DRAFT_961193 [Mycena floridula]